MTPYRRAHKNALDVQDACNFSGVLLAFARDMEAVREHMHATGGFNTRAFALHPVAILYMDKLADLQGRPGTDELSEAWDACDAVAHTPVPSEVP